LRRRKTLSPWSYTRNRMQTPKITITISIIERIVSNPVCSILLLGFMMGREQRFEHISCFRIICHSVWSHCLLIYWVFNAASPWSLGWYIRYITFDTCNEANNTFNCAHKYEETIVYVQSKFYVKKQNIRNWNNIIKVSNRLENVFNIYSLHNAKNFFQQFATYPFFFSNHASCHQNANHICFSIHVTLDNTQDL
jgi:hypothetical protein